MALPRRFCPKNITISLKSSELAKVLQLFKASDCNNTFLPLSVSSSHGNFSSPVTNPMRQRD